MGIIETIKMITREEALEEGIEKGFKEGKQEKSRGIVKNLLFNTDFDINRIAQLTETSKEFVTQIQQELKL